MTVELNRITTIKNKNVLNRNKDYYVVDKSLISEPHRHRCLSKNQKLGIQFSTAIGIIGSIALLAKCSKNKYSLSLGSILSTPFKDTFLGKEEYKLGKVLTIGAGSCAGGYLGGIIFDPDKNNIQAKKREALIQYTNISLPMATVAAASFVGDFITKQMPKSLIESPSKMKRFIGMSPKVIASLVGLGVGIWAGNKAANKLNHKIFHTNDNRPIELGDLSPHLDDVCIASQYIDDKNVLTKFASRFIPLALMVPGCEIGMKREKYN